ncbi:hypothetical protein HCO57_16435, partial [Croceivirga sp. JEA036]|nr:hypothetical protein [Croceivirga sp. JEA036]
SLSTVADNGDGTYTYTDEAGNTQTIDTRASSNPYDNTTSGLAATDVQAAIDEINAAAGTVALVDNGDGTYVFTDASGATTTISDTSLSTVADNGDGTYTYTDEAGNTQTIDTRASSNPYDNTTSGLAATDVQAAIDEINAAAGTVALVDNGDGTYVFTDASGATTTISDTSLSTVADNGDGTYTYTDEAGNTQTIDTRASSNPYDNTTSGLAATDVQAAIDEINAAAGTVALVDNGDGTYVFTDASGATTTISDTSISTLVNNGDGTYTYTDETGSAQTFDFVSNDANNDITVGSDGGLYLNVASVSIAETITNIADNGNGTFTYTNENGVAQTITKGDLTNNGDGTFTYNNGNGTPITFVGTDDQTATEVAITDAAGNFAANNVEEALAELATNSTDDQDLGQGAGSVANESVELTITDGASTTIDIRDADSNPLNEIQNLSEVLADGNDGGGAAITNIGDPTNAQDAATKAYVDALDGTDDQDLGQGVGGVANESVELTITDGASTTIDIRDADSNPLNEIQNLSEVLADGNDGGGAAITNIADPTNAQDAATKAYVDALDGTDDQDLGQGAAGVANESVELTITDGASTTIDIRDADSNPLNEIQTVASADGSVTVVRTGDDFDLSVDTTTTVANASSGNELTTTVNGVTGAPVDIINSNTVTLNGSNELVSTVNGEASTALDLTPAIQANQTTSSVVAGNGVSVTPTTTGNNTAYTVAVDEAAIADGTISSSDLTVTGGANSTFEDVTLEIAAGAVGTAELADDAVALEKLANGTANGQVMQWDGTEWTLVDLGSVTVTENDGVIGNEVVGPTDGTLVRSGAGSTVSPYTLDVATGGITSNEIATGAVNTDELADSAVTLGKLEDGANAGDMIQWNGTSWEYINPSTLIPANNDNDASNELQDLSLTGDNLTLSDDPTATPIDLSDYRETVVGANDITVTNDGNGNFTVDYVDGDKSDTNEIQNASQVEITDAAGNFTSTDVEGALAELATNSTDDQALSLAAGNILTLEDGGTVDLTPFLDNTDDQAITAFSLDNATNVLTITLENGGTQTVDLSNLDNAGTDDQTATEVEITDAAGNFTSTDVEGALAELATNSTDDQALSLAAGNILTLEDGGTVDLTPFLDNTDDQAITAFSLDNATNVLTITLENGGTQTVDLSNLDNAGTDDQALSLAAGNILTLEDGGTVDLTPFLDNTDDQAITAFSLDNATNVLTITLENGGTQTVDLSNLDNAGTDDQTATEVAITDAAGNFTSTDVEGALAELATNSTDDQALSLAAGNILTLEDGGTVDLTPFLDNTDDQAITAFSLDNATNVLTITLENGGTQTVDLSNLDNAGTDDQTATEVAITDAAGNFTSTDVEGALAELAAASTDDQDLGQGAAGVANESVELTITDGASTTIDIRDADSNPLNEIQTVASADGSVTVVRTGDDFDLSVDTTTTVANASSGNELTTTVNGVTGAPVDIINSNTVTLNGSNELVSTVNGEASTALDLTPAIQANQTTSSVVAGNGVSVTPTTTGNNTAYTVAVDEAAIADGTISSSDLTVTGGANSTFEDVTLEIAAGAVGTAELADDAVALEKLANGTANGQVMQWDGTEWTLVDLGSVTVTENDGVIGNEVVGPTDGTLVRSGAGSTVSPYTLDIATDGITSNEIATGAVNTDELADSAVTLGKLADGANAGDMIQWNGTSWEYIDPSTLIPANNDNDASNELQDLSLTGDNLTLSDDPTATPIDLSDYRETVVGANDITVTNDGNGNFTVDYVDGDNDDQNEIELPTGGVNGQVLSTDGSGNYSWVNPDSGPQGPAGTDGADGNGIASTVDNNDGTFTLNYTDGTSFTTSDLTGPQGTQGPAGNDGADGAVGPQGPQGPAGADGANGTDGNGIASTVDNNDGTFTLNYTDGTSFTTSDLTGPQGAQGPAGNDGADGAVGPQGPAGADGANGVDGNGIASTVDNNDGTFTLNYTDGTSFTTSDLTGPQGTQGPAGNDGADGAVGPQGPQGPAGADGANGADGNGIASTVDNNDGTFTLNYTDGTSFTTSDLTGPQGAQGPAGNDGADGAVGPQGPAGADGANGVDGNGIASTVDNNDGTFTLNYTDGTSFTTSD